MAKKSRNKNSFTADSKLHCEDCDTDVHVGTGGMSNLNTHRDSKTCRKNKATNALVPPQKTLFSFFTRKTTPRINSPPPIHAALFLPENTCHLRSATPVTHRGEIVEANQLQPCPSAEGCRSESNHSFDPLTKGTEENGIVDSCSAASSRVQPTQGIILTGPATSPLRRVCVGILVEFPPGKNHHTSYPSGLHNMHALPWDYHSIDDNFFLQSSRCTSRIGLSNETHQGEPCRACKDIRSDDNYDTIMYRIKHGVHPNSTLDYQPIEEIIELVRGKTDQIEQLHLTKLNDNRKLETLAVSKMAIDSEDELGSEGTEDHDITHLQDSEVPGPQETCMPAPIPQPLIAYSSVQGAPMPPPTTTSRQESIIQAENNQIQLDHRQIQVMETNGREHEVNNTSRRTSGRVRKRSEVDGKCECDTETTLKKWKRELG